MPPQKNTPTPDPGKPPGSSPLGSSSSEGSRKSSRSRQHPRSSSRPRSAKVSSKPLPKALPDLGDCMLQDHGVLKRLWRNLHKRRDRHQPDQHLVQRFNDKLAQSRKRYALRKNLKLHIEPDPALPIHAKRQEIAQTLTEHPVVIIAGQTGSGKSTQIPQICLELGRGIGAMVGHTQPRRLAARAIASRIAEETNTQLGHAIGCKVRFGDQTSPQTRIKVMTDGMLLAESRQDPLLLQYDTIILDEAHERSLNIDFLLGYFKQLLPRRPDLKLIITSATIDVQRFSKHFDRAPVIEVSGRLYPVEVRYRPLSQDQSLPQAIGSALGELSSQGMGDVLVFLPTERDIRETARYLSEVIFGDWEILMLFARLSPADQMRVFQPGHKRRVILSTNVAETSVTVPRIKYVIDSGLARLDRYSARAGVQRLPIEPISQASAEQRKGRCGRVSQGVCIRLYSEEDFKQRDAFTAPQMLRSNLASVILQMKALKLGAINQFPFLDPPGETAIRRGYKTLYELGAVNADGVMTEIGWQLASFPIDPRLARMLIEAHKEDCLTELLVLTAGMSVPDPRRRPADQQQAADAAHRPFTLGSQTKKNKEPEKLTSDFLVWLKLWDFVHTQSRKLSGNQFKKACSQNFLSYMHVRQWQDVRKQLEELIKEHHWKPNTQPATPDRIHRALLSGLLSQVAVRIEPHVYRGTHQNKLTIFPGSVLAKKTPPWIMAGQMVQTSRLFAQTVATLNPQWIEPLAGHLIKRHYQHRRWDRASKRAVVDEKVLLMGLTLVPKRTRPLDGVDPQDARQRFIHHALVEMDYDSDAPFMKHNRQLLKRVEQMQARVRRHDLLLDITARGTFFDARLPANITNGPRFEKWRQQVEKKNPRCLFMKLTDMMAPDAPPVDLTQYPSNWKVFGTRLNLTYRNAFGKQDDGVTCRVPIQMLEHLDENALHRMVPGLIESKILELLRALPKQIRVSLSPLARTAARCLPHVTQSDLPLAQAICQAIQQTVGYTLDPALFNPDALPEHLKPNLRVIDQHGQTLAQGRNLSRLRQQVAKQLAAHLEKAQCPDWRPRTGITRWDFGDLPRQVRTRRGKIQLPAWPAIVDDGDSVSLQLMDSRRAQQHATFRGLRRLYALQVEDQIVEHLQQLPGFGQMCLDHAPLGDRQTLLRQLVDRVVEETFLRPEQKALSPESENKKPETGWENFHGEMHGEIRKNLREQAGIWGEIRGKAAFVGRFDACWEHMAQQTQWLGTLTCAVFQARRQLDRLLESPWPKGATQAIKQVYRQRDQLMAEGFLLETPKAWLAHLPRYLAAMTCRLKKLQGGRYDLDAQTQQKIEPYQQIFDQLDPARRATHQAQRLGWMIEEYRVSLFAQQLGTSMTLSAKRLDKQVARVQRQNLLIEPGADTRTKPQPPGQPPPPDAIAHLRAKFSDPWKQTHRV